MTEIFTSRNIIRGLILSWLIAQAIVWMGEIQLTGFRAWFQASNRISYIKYLASLKRSQWIKLLRLYSIFLICYLLLLAIL